MNIRRAGRILSMCMLLTSFAATSVLADKLTTTAPDSVDLNSVKFKIVGAYFVDTLQGVNAKWRDTSDGKYRGLVLTVEVKKPAQKALSLHANDFSLHYYYGKDSTDVSPCHGVSGFSTVKGVDRPMKLSQTGRVASETGAATSSADTVYVDLFFQGFEPNTRELHLLMAQPCAAPFSTSGWKK